MTAVGEGLIGESARGRSKGEGCQRRVAMEFKFENIIEIIYKHYPDIAGSASSVTHKKGYAMHDYKLPAGILGSKHDAKIASEMIAGLLQI